jgi:hypothetical protein
MERNQLFSMALAAATLGLTACGGSDGVATTPGTGGTTTVVVTPATVACEAPTFQEVGQSNSFASVCFPAQSGTSSSRYDLHTFGCSRARVTKVDFPSSSSCVGDSTTNTVAAALEFMVLVSSSTTTVASLAADGITPVTGSGRTVTLGEIVGGSGSTFPSGIPLTSGGAYVVCKTTPASTTTARILPNFSDFVGSGYSVGTMTATFVLRSSAAGTSTINTAFGFDGGQFTRQYIE